MTLSFESRTLYAPDSEALLVTHDRQLVAIVIHLSSFHEEHAGHWFIEWTAQEHLGSREIFHTFEAASDWIDQHLEEPSGCATAERSRELAMTVKWFAPPAA